MRKITILGSTGSVGVQTLDIIRQFPSDFQVYGLSAAYNVSLLREQIAEFRPARVVLLDIEGAKQLSSEFPEVEINSGQSCIEELAADPIPDIVLSAIVGLAGLKPLLQAIKAHKTIALANKEPLVAAGALINNAVLNSQATLLPVDSEHSAIFQCLHDALPKEVKELVLTASGGPFRELKLHELGGITPEIASKHPRWQMGTKISIDSATMVNKGLEVIEAHWLFDIEVDKIRVVIHPESIVHSMVTFTDGATIAQLAPPDMRFPIAYALNWPSRLKDAIPSIDWSLAFSLNFSSPDLERFPALRLAQEAIAIGGTMPAVFNAANEAAVKAFTRRELSFADIVPAIEKVMQQHIVQKLSDFEQVHEVSLWAERLILS